MKQQLKDIFPMIREREDILNDIQSNGGLRTTYESWKAEEQKEFLDICSGARGLKCLYDGFFKEVMDPDSSPERLEEILSLLLGRKVSILKVLPNEGTRIGSEHSLVIMDIVVEMDDGSLANVEIQRLGYAFPGQRSACYSADLLLRQYKRVKSEKAKQFTYKAVQKVYTIIFFEKSPKDFKAYPENYVHHFKQRSDTGLHIELLQEFFFIPLDIYKKSKHNKEKTTRLDAWLTFFSVDKPEEILRFLEEYPDFKTIYEEIYRLCLDIERVMEVFSEELRIMDENTVKYMVEEMQEEIDQQKEQLDRQSQTIDELAQKNDKQLRTIDELAQKNDKQSQTIDTLSLKNQQLQAELEALRRQLK